MTFFIGAGIIVVLVFVLARKQDAMEAEKKRAEAEDASQQAGTQTEFPKDEMPAEPAVSVSQDFLEKYAEALTRLQKNEAFMEKMNQLRAGLAELDGQNADCIRTHIAEAFKANEICEHFPEVMAIAGAEGMDGKTTADTYTNVYYAVWMADL